MSFLALIPDILRVAQGVARIIPGETDDRILEIANRYVGVLQDVVPIVRGTDQEAPVNETLAQLVERVEAKADRVAEKLRGGN